MADTKISALTADTAPLNADVFPIVDTANTATKKITWANMLALGIGVYNVKAYGAIGNDTADDTAAIQAAIDAAQAAGGGMVWFPTGTYKITTVPLKLYSGATPTIVAYQNITLAGVGGSGTGGSVIKQYTTGIDVIKGLNDVANGAQALNIVIRDIELAFGGAVLTNSGNGIYLAAQAGGSPSFQEWTIENVQCLNFQGSGKYGFNFESMITSTVRNCQTNSCANGFYWNGAAASAYSSVSTSVVVMNCYANMATNGVLGYNCVDNTYMTFIGCAADFGVNTTGSAYRVVGSSGVAFYSCGSELASVTLTQMWNIDSSNGVGLYNCYAFQSKTCVDILVTNTSLQVTIIGFTDSSSVSGSTGLKVDAGSQVTEIDNNWGTVATPRNINATGVDLIPNTIRVQTTASSATPAINVGTTDLFSITALAAAITSMTSSLTGTAINGQKLVIRIKDNGTARAITWGTSYEARGVALPTTTVISKVLTVGFIYDTVTSKWGCVASAQEA